jgi:hypothetical protein
MGDCMSDNEKSTQPVMKRRCDTTEDALGPVASWRMPKTMGANPENTVATTYVKNT